MSLCVCSESKQAELAPAFRQGTKTSYINVNSTSTEAASEAQKDSSLKSIHSFIHFIEIRPRLSQLFLLFFVVQIAGNSQ